MASAGLHDVRYDSEFPDDRTIADELLRAADQAIYRKMRGPKSAARSPREDLTFDSRCVRDLWHGLGLGSGSALLGGA